MKNTRCILLLFEMNVNPNLNDHVKNTIMWRDAEDKPLSLPVNIESPNVIKYDNCISRQVDTSTAFYVFTIYLSSQLWV